MIFILKFIQYYIESIFMKMIQKHSFTHTTKLYTVMESIYWLGKKIYSTIQIDTNWSV